MFEFPFNDAEDFETEAWVENWVSGSNSKPILDKFIHLNGFRCFRNQGEKSHKKRNPMAKNIDHKLGSTLGKNSVFCVHCALI